MGDQELTAPTGPDLEEETQEEKIQKLVRKLGVSENEAKIALDSAEGDIQEAESIIRLLEKNHFIFIFKAADLDMEAPFAGIGFGQGVEGGSFTLMLYPLADEVAYADISIEQAPEEFHKQAILSAPDEDSPATALDWVKRKIDMETVFKDSIEKIFKHIQNTELEELNQWMHDVLLDMIPELENFAVNGKTCSPFDINKFVKALKIEVPLMGDDELPVNLEDLDVLLHCNVEVSPVTGRRADKLRLGDMVAVKIVDQRDIAVYLAELLGGLKDGEIRPLLAKVEEIEETQTGRLNVRVSFGPAVKGEFSVLKEVKIAYETISEKDIEKLTTPVEPVFQERQYNKITSYLLWLIVLGIIIIVIVAKVW